MVCDRVLTDYFVVGRFLETHKQTQFHQPQKLSWKFKFARRETPGKNLKTLFQTAPGVL